MRLIRRRPDVVGGISALPLILVVTLLAGPAPAARLAAQEPPAPRNLAADSAVGEALRVVETWLEAQRDYDRIPGLSAAIVKDQALIWSGAFGEAHREGGVAATPRTVYSICSISKLFTSIALMQLRDRGLVRLSDPVADHLPWFRLRAPDDAPPVTIEGILTHAAGLPRESDHAYWSAPEFEFPTREEVIEGLANQEALYPPWRYFQYSNLGLTLAGEIVRERSGMPYDEYVRRHILEPLGLRDTWPEMPEAERGRRLATGYGALNRQGEREPLPFFRARGIAPAAGYASTVEDLARFASWQFRLEGDRPEVLHPHTLREMQRVHYVDPGWDTFWGLGFSIQRADGRTFVGHGGSCPGYRSQLLLDMEDEIATVFMANASGIDTGKFARGLYDLLAPALRAASDRESGEDDEGVASDEAAPSPRATNTSTGSPAAPGPPLSDYVGTYSAQPWGGETAVVIWKGGLALLPLPTDDPAEALTRLKRVEGDVFRRIRDDDELGEAIAFERDGAGRVVRLRRFNNLYPRIR